MKNQNAFLRQISKNGLYIILFLCVLAVGISGYVMYRVQEEEIPLADEVMQVEEPYVSEYEPIVLPEDTEPIEEIVKKEEPPAEIPVANLKPQYVTAVAGEVVNAFTGDEMVKSKTFGDWRTHAGIDISAKVGSEVYAISDGTVSDVYEDALMGHTVVIEHKEKVVSRYCNLAPEITVKKGDKISLGTVIGNVGNSAAGECMEVEHLHLEVTRDGAQIDPMSLVE